MLAKPNRLKHKRDIDAVFTHGRSISGTHVFIKYWKIDETAYPKRGYLATDLKFAVIVGKKVSKSAVERNLIKRRLRAIIRSQYEGLVRGYHVVVSAKPQLKGTPYSVVEEELSVLLHKICR